HPGGRARRRDDPTAGALDERLARAVQVEGAATVRDRVRSDPAHARLDAARGARRRLDAGPVRASRPCRGRAHPRAGVRGVSGADARALAELRRSDGPARAELAAFVEEYRAENEQRFNSQLYSRSTDSPLRIGALPPRYEESAATVDGRIVLLRCFDANLARDPRI